MPGTSPRQPSQTSGEGTTPSTAHRLLPNLFPYPCNSKECLLTKRSARRSPRHESLLTNALGSLFTHHVIHTAHRHRDATNL